MGGCLSLFESYRQWKLKKYAQAMRKVARKQEQQVQVLARQETMLKAQVGKWKSRGFRPQARLSALHFKVIRKQRTVEEKRLIGYRMSEVNAEIRSRDADAVKFVKHISDASKLQDKSMGNPIKLQKQITEIKKHDSNMTVLHDMSQEAVPDMEDIGGREGDFDADELDEIIDDIDEIEISPAQMRQWLSMPDPPDHDHEYVMSV